jgi:hypothetical protein
LITLSSRLHAAKSSAWRASSASSSGLPKHLITIWIQSHSLDNAFDGKAHATIAGLPVHYRGVDRDAIKAIHF